MIVSESEGIIDWASARAAAEGDGEILRTVVVATIEELPGLVRNLHESLQSDDAPTAHRTAHTIKGMARTFGLTKLHHLAEATEADTDTGATDSAGQGQKEITRLANQVVSELSQYIAGSDS